MSLWLPLNFALAPNQQLLHLHIGARLIPKPVRSSGWGNVSRGARRAGCGPIVHAGSLGYNGTASPR